MRIKGTTTVWAEGIELKYALSEEIPDATPPEEVRQLAFEILHSTARAIVAQLSPSAYIRDLRVSRIYK